MSIRMGSILLLCVCALSCAKQKDLAVYAAGWKRTGSHERVACYWKNGEEVVLPSGAPESVIAYTSTRAITLSDNGEVYLAGHVFLDDGPYGKEVACYWKNGVQTVLDGADTSNHSWANAITVAGKDVYVAGSVYVDGGTHGRYAACYWKNGAQVLLTDGKTDHAAYAIAILNGDVYVAGSDADVALPNTACYWKNGVKITLTDGSSPSSTSAMTIAGRDLYIAGWEDKRACYWKNGVQVNLTDGTKRARAYAIAVSGREVYVAGSEESADGRAIACLWKNGGRTIVEMGMATAVAVLGREVYVASHTTSADGRRIAYYWKNGKVERVPAWGFVRGVITAIAVAEVQ